MKQCCPLLIFISISLLLASPIQAQDTRKPVIDMHMHGYLGELAMPNPITGKILVHNGDEHRKASLRLMEDHNVVLAAVSANGDLETALQTFTTDAYFGTTSPGHHMHLLAGGFDQPGHL